MASQPPQPVLPKSSKRFRLRLLDIDPLELARQLTLMEAALYQKIRPTECIQHSREPGSEKLRDNVSSIIQLGNRVCLESLLN